LSLPSRIGLKVAAAVAGVIATGAFLVGFNIWVKTQGSDEAALTAASSLTVAEARLGEAVAALQKLAGDGVDSCSPTQRAAMQHAALRTGPVKELMLLGADGQALCTGSGAALGRIAIEGSAAPAGAPAALEVVRLPGLDRRFLRVRSLAAPGKPSLAALVPVSLLLPQAAMQGGPWRGYARLVLSDGTMVGEAGTAPPQGGEAPRPATLRSAQFPLAVTVSTARRGVIAGRDDLSHIAVVISGALALVILLFALVMSRLRRGGPIDDIERAIDDDQFVPYYQPLVDLQNGRLLGVEVLVRWRRPDGSLVEPDTFVLALESTNLVLELTRRLMRRVCQELGEAVGRRPSMTIAFNIAPKHFDDALILSDLGTIFNGSPIRLSQLVLELTERHEVVNLASMRRAVAALQRIGCRIAIDDVGTGHSGLSYILKLGVDIIKMDKIFVEAIDTEGHSRAIIDTLIDLAKNMRMEIIAEGVETFDQVSYLRERGITAAQGYVFAPPLPATTFLQLLEAMDPADGPDSKSAAAD
jgi:sensor c-di-GMP phosphodiesterase-like protein